MNATKTAVNRAFAIIAVMALMLCSFAAIFATESEAADYSSLQQSGTDVDQVYTLDISTGQQFEYQNIATNLDGYGSISYTWTGTAADETAKADANIYGGTFRVAGQAAFSVFQYVDVEFTPSKPVGEHTGSDITVVGGQAGMTIEYRVGGGNNTSVVVNGGTFSAVNADKSNGIWYGEATSKLTITGGTFGMYNDQKVYDSGLYFEAKPNSGKVQLSGGTYYGNADRAYGYSGIIVGDLYPYYNNGAISAPCSRNGVSTWSGIGSEIEVRNILVGGHTAACSGGYISGNYTSGSDAMLGESFGGTDLITIS